MLKFDIITEADARTLDIGSTVELAAGGHVTPLGIGLPLAGRPIEPGTDA